MSDLTLRQLYSYCHDNSVDVEIRIKCDGRCGMVFERGIDGARHYAEFDFERDVENLPALPELDWRPVLTPEERVRLETPR